MRSLVPEGLKRIYNVEAVCFSVHNLFFRLFFSLTLYALLCCEPPPPPLPFRLSLRPELAIPGFVQHKENKKADPLTLMTMCFKEVGAVSSARPILDSLVVGMSKVPTSTPHTKNDTLRIHL